MSSLNLVSNFVCVVNIAMRAHLQKVSVRKSKFILQIADLLYKNGAIEGFSMQYGKVQIFLKYKQGKSVISSFEIVSKPGKRIYWRLSYLSDKYNISSFAGFYVVSTSKGLLTSTECLSRQGASGEVILKVAF